MSGLLSFKSATAVILKNGGVAEKTSKARPSGKTLSTDKNVMFFQNKTFSSVDRFYFSLLFEKYHESENKFL